MVEAMEMVWTNASEVKSKLCEQKSKQSWLEARWPHEEATG